MIIEKLFEKVLAEINPHTFLSGGAFVSSILFYTRTGEYLY